MRKLVAALVMASVLGAPAVAQQAPAAGVGLTRAEMEARVRERFAQIDANRDGYVTQGEAKGFRAGARGARRGDRQERREAAFARLDVDRNGSISRAEFLERRAGAERGDRRERRAERRAERRERLAERREARRGGLAVRRFARVDADRDGRLSLAEVLNRRVQAFVRADANRDGRVTRDERRAVREARRAARG